MQAHLHDAAAGQRIATALGSLVHSDAGGAAQQAGVAGRQHRRVFRQSLCDVVTDVRSLICMR